MNTIYVKTSDGLVKGLAIQVLNQTVNQFLGIPFAEPPIGRNRFGKPEAIKRKRPIIDATKTKFSCIQASSPLIGNVSISEDCLYLNVWSPASNQMTETALKPVLFHIFGGAFSIGSIYELPKYNGSVLATNDIVFVSANYRLGHFGFLYGGDDSAPGNVAFFDQLLALKWVRENIHFFGGNKDMITLFGQSAGSWSVSQHILSPLAKGLFNKAIMSSGALFFNKDRPVISRTEALSEAKQLANDMKCHFGGEWLNCLRRVEAKEFIKYTKTMTFPVSETEYLPRLPQKTFDELQFNRDVDLMAGVATHEGSMLTQAFSPTFFKQYVSEHNFTQSVSILDQMLHSLDLNKVKEHYLKNVDTNSSFANKWAFYEFFGDLLIKCPTYLFAKQYAKKSTKNNVFFYEITYQQNNLFNMYNALGVTHGAESEFIFGLPLLDPKSSEDDIHFSKYLMKLWTDFAKSGKPTNNWPKFIDSNNEKRVKELNPHNLNRILVNPYTDTCDEFWRSYFESTEPTVAAKLRDIRLSMDYIIDNFDKIFI